MTAIELKGVSKLFGRRPGQVLSLVEAGATKEEILERTGHTVGLRDVSLTMEAGRCFVVMGLSGSGKSTLVRLLNRLIEPTTGEVRVDGEDVLGLDDEALLEFRRHKVSMVFQRFGLFPHKTVLQNISYGLDVQADGRAQRAANRETARQWVEMVGLAGYEASYPDQLSGGMQQRVGLARALATDPDILLMDEPFSALDPLIRRDMQDQLMDLQNRLRKTIVFITHDLDEALRLGDRIAILKDGALVQVGGPSEILTAPADDYVAAFTRDVDRGRTLRVRLVMDRLPLVVGGSARADTLLAQMEKGRFAAAYVMGDGHRLAGAVTLADAKKGARTKSKTLDRYLRPVVPVGPDTPLNDVLPMVLRSEVPVPVLDGDRLIGVVPREAVVEALAPKVNNK